MKIIYKILLFGLIILLIPATILNVTMNNSLEQLSESEIGHDMENNINLAIIEYNHFEHIESFVNLMTKRNVFLTAFQNRDTNALRALISPEIETLDVDFVTIVDTDMRVFARTKTNISGDITPFDELVEHALTGRYIYSTEILSNSELVKEDLESSIIIMDEGKTLTSALVQVYIAPIYVDKHVAGAIITGRMLNNRSYYPDEVDGELKDSTTIVYQLKYCVATGSKKYHPNENIEELLGTTLPDYIMKEMYTGTISVGDLDIFSTPHVYGATPIKNYNGEVIGSIMVASPKERYLAAIKKTDQSIMGALFISIVLALLIILFSIKNIIKPLDQLNYAAKYVTDEKGYKKIETINSDEIGEVTKSFNTMVDWLIERDRKAADNAEELQQMNQSLLKQATELEKQQNQEIAYSTILTTLGSTIDLNTILSKGLHELMEYTKSPIGTVYLYDAKRKVLMPFVTRGTKKIVAEKEFALNEGIPGEVAFTREMKVIANIPSDAIYEMETGLCDISPKSIVATPMIFKDMLLGVIITSHLTEVTPDILQFTKRIVDQHAVAVNNANTYQQSQKMAISLKIQRDELDIKSQELEKASRLKSDFLANMSHELRTPLNSIIGFSDLIQDETFGTLNQKQLKYINNILTSGKHLLSLINDILDLSKIEAGKIELYYEKFDISTVFNEVKTVITPLATKKNIVIQHNFDPELTSIKADKGKIKQVFYNLISNAIKFSPQNGTIVIEGQRNGNMLQISIKDNGIGISKENQKKLFKPFVQVDASASRAYSGTGLGLALVKQFVEIHGGNVWLESELGKGSTFIFTILIEDEMKIPKTVKELEYKSEVKTKNEQAPIMQVPMLKENAEAEINETIEIPKIVEPKGGTGDEPLILVVEDEKEASELLTIALNKAGYRVVTAYRGKDALKIVKTLKPFAITLDVMLPGMDGWEVLNSLKNNPNTCNIPVIIISMVDNKEIGFALGAVDYFIKPVDKNTLFATLDNLEGGLGKELIKVLVVDDEPNAVELIALMIEPQGYEAIRAYGGQEGINKAFKEHPDLLILDLMMPVVSGIDVISELKLNPETKDIPIIICTAKDLTDDDLKVLKNNVVSIMRKGMFTNKDILNEIKKYEMLRR